MDGTASEMFSWGLDVATNPRYTIWIIAVLLVAESVLCALIIRTVPYTETVLKGYIDHARLYMSGIKDYTLFPGDNGPTNRPALHIYVCRFLAYVAQYGANVVLAQVFFAFLYVFNLGLAMLCYKQAKVSNYVFPMLCLSKRLHSIYVLRCFDDGFTVMFLFLAIYQYQHKNWTAGTLCFACGLAVDMNLICALPAVAVILGQAIGLWGALIQISNLLQIQLVLAVPFMQGNPRAYLLQVFGGLGHFKQEGMVNWHFLDPARLASTEFALGLIALHIAIISGFVCSRWLQQIDRSFPKNVKILFRVSTEKELEKRAEEVTPDFVLTTMLTSIAVSMLCARSLHPESLAWGAWAIPFLLWRSRLNPVLQYLLWSGQELAWNRVPADDLSSQLILGVLTVVVVQTWIATDLDDVYRLEKVQRQARMTSSTPQRSKKLEQEAGKIVNDPDWPI